MKRHEIEDAITDIMQIDGPDGHMDGSNVIVDFIVALLDGQENARKWISEYREKHFANATEE